MARISAGILMYRREGKDLFVLLVHPGGPFWRKRDLGAWSIPKGEVGPGEDPEATARREFAEELGVEPAGELHYLADIRQRGGKHVIAFTLEGDFDVANHRCSSMVRIEWPPRSGQFQSFPEVDQAAWFPLGLAREKILESQRVLLDRLEEHCSR
ncbi:NUDIX domain-containing protein [Rhodoligotrophos defluvii]|uniref:NUDIX domain-containing protein n=1 Tax=Rhodoligotrophos defluvii TaxID=2561934 RepID=UPI0010C9F1C9|nr:NUDIX domain-containing protein [Rhodoligotrophos defluvii]